MFVPDKNLRTERKKKPTTKNTRNTKIDLP
jgi:hypothetical protein